MKIQYVALFLTCASATLERNENIVIVDQGLHDRNLRKRTYITNSTSLSFSFASATNAKEMIDYQSLCLEQGSYFQATYADTNTSEMINAFAVAVSEESLWLTATCATYATACSQVCAFTKVDGAVNVAIDTNLENLQSVVSMDVALSLATTTFAMAKSVAVAESYTNVNAKAFTSVTTFCQQVRNKSPLCSGGTASTDLRQLAEAKASSLGDAGAVAVSGSIVNSTASVRMEGMGLFFIKSFLAAYAKNWVFVNAGAAVSAFTNAFTDASNGSFSSTCVAQHGQICSDPDNVGEGVCQLSAEDACANAAATGKSWSEALSAGCAKAFIEAQASNDATFVLSANVDCKNKPYLTWKCSDGFFRFGNKNRTTHFSTKKKRRCQRNHC